MRTILLAMLTLALAGCGETDEPRPLVVFAAASTTDVMARLIEAYGQPIDCSFASSSTLARQIEAGAPADVYLCANAAWMDHLAERNLIDPSTRRDAAANQLVVIAPAGSRASLDADFAGRIALGDPDHVPAGIYAKQALERMELWPQLQSRTIAAIDVRAALRYVETGEAQLGIVYATDAKQSTRVTIIKRIDPALHDPIHYPVAATQHADARAAAFIAYLVSEDAAEIWRAAGFEPISNNQ